MNPLMDFGLLLAEDCAVRTGPLGTSVAAVDNPVRTELLKVRIFDFSFGGLMTMYLSDVFDARLEVAELTMIEFDAVAPPVALSDVLGSIESNEFDSSFRSMDVGMEHAPGPRRQVASDPSLSVVELCGNVGIDLLLN
ncbi:unnamed protein product [Gongylonema pulchrum]|uniref:Uncharacterized protein n=1 Tax=Gongylonema pulchrum TaxID=637853 RepID=A0A183DWT8_9BILA|nr:unnamed protein product [Gongylonema pulchrum]